MDRREVLGVMAGLAVAGGGSSPAGASSASAQESASSGMIYRTLGKTGEKVSAIGLGGYHIGTQSDVQ